MDQNQGPDLSNDQQGQQSQGQPNQQQSQGQPNQQQSQGQPNQQQNPNQQNQQQGNYAPPPMPPLTQPYPPKSRVAAGVLGILLGSLGIHNFYLGYKGKALAQLLITVLTCGIGAAVTGIWGLVEGIMILTGSIAVDGQGFPLAN